MFDRIITSLVALSMALLVWLYLRSRDREMLDSVPIPVQIALSPDQADHYELELESPSQVPVSFAGPPSRIRELRGMLQRGEVRVELTVTVPDHRLQDGRYQETIRIDPRTLNAPAGVLPLIVEGRNRIPVTVYRLVERRLPVRYQASAEDQIAQVTLEPASVLVRGPQDLLDRFRSISTQPYPLPGRAETTPAQEVVTTLTVPLVRELNGRLIRAFPDAVTAHVKRKAQQRIYELADVPIQFLCPPNFSLRPLFGDERAGRMTLRLSGPAGEETPSVVAFIDLGGRKWEPGLYEESIRLQLPRDFQLAQPALRPVAFQLVPAAEARARPAEAARGAVPGPPGEYESLIRIMSDLAAWCEDLAQRARVAARALATASGARKNRWLQLASADLVDRSAEILQANELDLAAATQAGLAPASIDRLRLSPARIATAAKGLLEIASLPEPIGRVLDSTVRPNGLQILKVGVPLGVIFFIYESRPNVTVDAAGLCVKSGNAILLRGGKEALHSNIALQRILQDAIRRADLPEDSVQLVTRPDRDAVGHFLRMHQFIDLAIPRGGESLIRRVTAEATMPVLKHYQGICHVYVDRAADLDMAERIVVNAKCQRPGVCNAAECLLVHCDIADAFLPRLGEMLKGRGVEIRGCAATCRLIPWARPAEERDYGTEFLDLILAVKVVAGLDPAMEHIAGYGSAHTDAIVTNDLATAQRFTATVDSSAVLVNASTRFNDGYEFGLGAEIGISTDKFHARGPCGLLELTSYKYVVLGTGQVRD